ncbi:MAG: NTP transferase domain-containing protein [Lentisphaerae bacterium]|nr:NTP transferase domain-containing protein [Lentisphaerota bacterium]
MVKSLVVLAAGMGSRFGGLKQMEPVGPNGEFILDYSVQDAISAGTDKIVFVIRKDLEKDFREIVGRKWENRIDIDYAMQEMDDLPEGFSIPEDRRKPWGTAHAVFAARNVVNGPFMVVNADDFYGAEAFRLNSQFLSDTSNDANSYGMVAYRLDKTLSKYGTVSRGVCAVDDDGMLIDIEERLTLKRCDDGIIRDGDTAFADETFVSMNMYAFKRSFMDHLAAGLPAFLKSAEKEPEKEYQITTELRHLLHDGLVTMKVMQTASSWFGITSPEDKDEVVARLKTLKQTDNR